MTDLLLDERQKPEVNLVDVFLLDDVASQPQQAELGARNPFFGSSDISGVDGFWKRHVQPDTIDVFEHPNQARFTFTHHSHASDETRNLRPTDVGSRLWLRLCAKFHYGRVL